MNAAICYSSMHHGNTRQIAEAMAKALDASLWTVEEASNMDGEGLDLIGLGSGIYFGRHAASLIELVHKCKTIPRHAFVFSTAGIAALSGWWHRSLARALKSRGCEIVDQFCCPGWDTVGPLSLFGGLHRRRPDERDLDRARQFALDLKAKVLHSQSVSV